jgi:hypothetical protein
MYNIPVEEPEGKESLSKHGNGWEDNTKIGLKEIVTL